MTALWQPRRLERGRGRRAVRALPVATAPVPAGRQSGVDVMGEYAGPIQPILVRQMVDTDTPPPFLPFLARLSGCKEA